MVQGDWPLFLHKNYSVPDPVYAGIYILGCFARHVTLYSQQVRALNLIFALHETGKLSSGTRVAVIGGGAAGLTAAAGAAHRKAKVTLLEKFEDLMELQQNNRQRWIHPHIYDWPYISKSGFAEVRGDRAELPLLPWAAEYAANVATQIVTRWKVLQSGYSIDARWPVHDITIAPPTDRTTWISWNERGRPLQHEKFDVVILAVGFGLEDEKDFRFSYWTDDDLDSGFREYGERRQWLVSGCGDGALIDLMRLCMRKFRHDEILQQFATAHGIDAVKADLVRILSDPRSTTEEGLSQQFEKELTIPDHLQKIVKDKFRKNGPTVTLVTRTPHLYGSKTSILNRVLVRILAENGRFTHKVGETNEKKIRRQKGRFWVPIRPVIPSKVKRGRRNDGERTDFDRVLIRHGPDSVLEQLFPDICSACGDLASHWNSLPINEDETREPQWRPDFFGQERPARWLPATVPSAGFGDPYKQYGVWAKAVTVYNDIRDDGSSTVTFEIKDLSLLHGELSGIHFYYESKTGQIGPPRLRADTPQTQLDWEDDSLVIDSAQGGSEDESTDRTFGARERARRLSGIVRVKRLQAPDQPPQASDQPLSMSLTFTLQNSDALSSWEFEQMYGSESRVHMDKTPLDSATEYFARIVWFPVETLKLRVTLPKRLGAVPYPNAFIPSRNEITSDDMVRDSVLQFSPTTPSKWRPTPLHWKPERFEWKKDPLSHLFEDDRFTMPSPQTWELAIQHPVLGSCYSLDWPLAQAPENDTSRKLSHGAKMLRRKFMAYAKTRRKGPVSGVGSRVRRVLVDLYEILHSRYGLKNSDERFLISLMTYDEGERRLVLVDAVVRGGEPEERMWNFWLPFGLGLAGSCFRQAQAFIYRAPDPRSLRVDADSYLPVPHGEVNQCLLALPVDHPELDTETIPKMPVRFERSQQCLGVINIASNHQSTNLRKIVTGEEIREIRNLCQLHCDQICALLKVSDQ